MRHFTFFPIGCTGSPILPFWLTGLVRRFAALAHRNFTGNAQSLRGVPRLSFTPGLRPLLFNNSWKSENRFSKSKIEILALASM